MLGAGDHDDDAAHRAPHAELSVSTEPGRFRKTEALFARALRVVPGGILFMM